MGEGERVEQGAEGTDQAGVSVPDRSLYSQPAHCQRDGCSRNATRATGFAWCYWHDPSIPEATKTAARALGGRRGLMGSTEAILLLDGATLTTPEGRQDVRARLIAARAAGKLGGPLYRDLLAGLADAAKDIARNAPAATASPVVVEIARFDSQDKNSKPETSK